MLLHVGIVFTTRVEHRTYNLGLKLSLWVPRSGTVPPTLGMAVDRHSLVSSQSSPVACCTIP